MSSPNLSQAPKSSLQTDKNKQPRLIQFKKFKRNLPIQLVESQHLYETEPAEYYNESFSNSHIENSINYVDYSSPSVMCSNKMSFRPTTSDYQKNSAYREVEAEKEMKRQQYQASQVSILPQISNKRSRNQGEKSAATLPLIKLKRSDLNLSMNFAQSKKDQINHFLTRQTLDLEKRKLSRQASQDLQTSQADPKECVRYLCKKSNNSSMDLDALNQNQVFIPGSIKKEIERPKRRNPSSRLKTLKQSQSTQEIKVKTPSM